MFGYLFISELLSLIPGKIGIWVRRVWYEHVFSGTASGPKHLTVNWLAVIRTERAVIRGDYVSIGPGCWIGEAIINDNVKIANNVTVLSGMHQHIKGKGAKRIIIGSNCWIGAHAVIGADVAPDTVVGAGAVVTRTYKRGQTLVGIPARPIKGRK